VEESIVEYVEHSRNLPMVVIEEEGKALGFCTLKPYYSLNLNLYVLGILPEYHRQGLGQQMIEFITRYCRDKGIPYMTVLTLSDQSTDPSYGHTRNFYQKCGFCQLQDFPTLWDEQNPCLMMLKEVDL